jgi:diacylglycerol O-acyltransferase
VAIFSYDGALNFGVTGDYDSAKDIGVLCDGIEQGMAELVGLSQPAPARPKRAAPKARARRTAKPRKLEADPGETPTRSPSE